MEHDDDVSDSGPRVRDLLTLGAMLCGCVVVGVAVGWYVDERFGSDPIGIVVGLALGIVAAGVGFWLRVRSFLRS